MLAERTLLFFFFVYRFVTAIQWTDPHLLGWGPRPSRLTVCVAGASAVQADSSVFLGLCCWIVLIFLSFFLPFFLLYPPPPPPNSKSRHLPVRLCARRDISAFGSPQKIKKGARGTRVECFFPFIVCRLPCLIMTHYWYRVCCCSIFFKFIFSLNFSTFSRLNSHSSCVWLPPQFAFLPRAREIRAEPSRQHVQRHPKDPRALFRCKPNRWVAPSSFSSLGYLLNMLQTEALNPPNY